MNLTFTQRKTVIEAARKYRAANRYNYPYVHVPLGDCGADIVTVDLTTDPPTIKPYERSMN